MSALGADAASVLSHGTASTNGTRSIYPKGATFSLDTFSNKDFIVKDFVESLSDSVNPALRRSGPSSVQTFDPKPYIRVFEHALTRLGGLSDEREAHENELSSAVRRAENSHKQHCATLQRKLDQALESFNSLENRLDNTTISGIGGRGSGNIALEIGERLEALDKQKRRAEDAKFLIHCWSAVRERGDLSELEDIRRLGGADGKVKCAQIARQLLRISDRLNKTQRQVNVASRLIDDYNNQTATNGDHQKQDTSGLIEKFLERLEQDLLEQFEEYKRQHNDDGMRECATVLHDFADGASIIGRYVSQHEFFLERSHMVTESLAADNDIWDRLADPDSQAPGLEISLQSLIDEVKLVLEEESFNIKQIFPFRDQVMATFIQRVFQQSIQQRLELVLDKADSVSSLAFLRTLQAARNYVGAMVDDLKSHGLTEHPESASPAIAGSLDQQLEDLFIPYLTGSQYLDREKRSLEELYGSVLFRFTTYHAKRRKNPTSYLGSLSQRGRELLSTARDAFMDRLDSTELPSSQKAVYLQIAGLNASESKDRSTIETSEADGALSLAVAKRMLKWLAEGVGRGLELSGGSETPKDVSALTKLLLIHMGDIYLDTSLDGAFEQATTQETAKTEPDMTFVTEVQAGIRTLQLTMTVVKQVLLPLVSPNVTVSRDVEKAVNGCVSRIEEKVGAVEGKAIDVILAWVAKLLARQNRGDFRPRDDAFGIEQLQTSTCTSILAYLGPVRDGLLKAVEGKNSEVLFTDLAMGFRTQLLDHFKKFQVNLAGGLMVSKDITRYIELLRTFPLSTSFRQSMEVLVEIGNIFVIGPDALKDRLRGGGALTGVSRSDLRPYILKRDDATTVGVQAVLNAL